jgi:hypothetical protein
VARPNGGLAVLVPGGDGHGRVLVLPGPTRGTPTALSLPTFERFLAEEPFVGLSNGSRPPLGAPARDEWGAALVAFIEALAANRSER